MFVLTEYLELGGVVGKCSTETQEMRVRLPLQETCLNNLQNILCHSF